MFVTSFVTLALASLPAFASPVLDARQITYTLYNDGTKGTLEGTAADFGATYHASALLSKGGCSSTASIQTCYAAQLSADVTKNLETKDTSKPYLPNGIGKRQRAVLLTKPYTNATGVITHKVRFHISSTFNQVPVGTDEAATFVALRNLDPSVGLLALDVRARVFIGEETSGTWLYLAMRRQDGQEEFPPVVSLDGVVGKTIEVTYVLGTDGKAIDADGNVASISCKFVGQSKAFMSAVVSKSQLPNGPISSKTPYEFIFGADRGVAAGQKELKAWFGDYTVSPAA
ncbi:hypothetical protein BKA62DRAFT_277806 [Auriculariales sp. MPI-PUGE-AT-0066]|nr:hypothetical protein BKA62DRAFT_277806 [Auriculariales sp. MPI-PUGE-AT-0066]